ncbi:MAG TPA: hypothetical protein VIF82_11185 [Burkholderiaceae bacterium]|jgi:hypothetical protein
MRTVKYKESGSSTTSPVNNKTRKEVLIKVPKYSQSFNISTLLDYDRMHSELKGQPYRIVLPSDVIKLQGTITDKTDVVRTESSVKVRCEIGGGKWEILEDGYIDDFSIENETEQFE